MQNKNFIFNAAQRLILLTILSAAFALTATAQKPQAILFGEWSEPNATTQSRVIYPAARQPFPSSRARIVKTAAPAPVAAPATTAFYPVTNRKSKSRINFAALRPSSIEEQAFALINEKRREQGLSPLVWDLEMLYVARQHSQSMADNRFFSHTGLDGKTVDDRADAVGVSDWRAIGENIAFNQGVKNQAEFAVQCWLQSKSHKENMLGKKWTRSGIGVAVTAEGRFYITQVFRN